MITNEIATSEHFNYECAMLQYCFNRLVRLVTNGANPAEFNLTHEAFVVHAKNLFLIVEDPDPTYDKDWEEYHKYLDMMLSQVLTFHLEKRTSKFEEKLQFPKDHLRILEIINKRMKQNGLEEIYVLEFPQNNEIVV